MVLGSLKVLLCLTEKLSRKIHTRKLIFFISVSQYSNGICHYLLILQHVEKNPKIKLERSAFVAEKWLWELLNKILKCSYQSFIWFKCHLYHLKSWHYLNDVMSQDIVLFYVNWDLLEVSTIVWVPFKYMILRDLQNEKLFFLSSPWPCYSVVISLYNGHINRNGFQKSKSKKH